MDEWDVDAPVEAVHAAVGDASTYPEWWRPTYHQRPQPRASAASARSNHHHFRGPLPYTLEATTTTTRYEPPALVATAVEGDLRGTGAWTLTADGAAGTHVRFDWRVFADRRFLRVLTPVLRPLFRWNHAWAISAPRPASSRTRAAGRPRSAAAPEPAVNVP